MRIFSTKIGLSRDLGLDDLCMPSMGSSVAAAHDHVVSGGISFLFPPPLKWKAELSVHLRGSRGDKREIRFCNYQAGLKSLCLKTIISRPCDERRLRFRDLDTAMGCQAGVGSLDHGECLLQVFAGF
jgi:hypothetical protein